MVVWLLHHEPNKWAYESTKHTQTHSVCVFFSLKCKHFSPNDDDGMNIEETNKLFILFFALKLFIDVDIITRMESLGI